MTEPLYISSRNNSYVIKVHSLSEKKYRDSERLFCADGFKLFCEACACGMAFDSVIIREDKQGEYLDDVRQKAPSVQVYILSESAFDKVTEEKAPQGIISVLKYAENIHKKVISVTEAKELIMQEPAVLALESLRDPGNLGTIIRTAAAFGTGALLVSDDCADIYNPRTVRAAMGALFTRKVIRVPNLGDVIKELTGAGRRVYATTLSDTAGALQDMTLRSDDIFIIGNEGHGLSRQVVDVCTGAVFIRMLTGPGIESLNAGIAASVVMYERTRCQ